MNRCTGWCLALLLTLITAPALGDDALQGAWALTAVGEGEPAPGQKLTYEFADESVRVTITAAGLSQTWELAYTVSAQGELTVEPTQGLGDPAPTVFSYRIEEGQLVLELEGMGAAMTFARMTSDE